jgi:hypothetical protein
VARATRCAIEMMRMGNLLGAAHRLAFAARYVTRLEAAPRVRAERNRKRRARGRRSGQGVSSLGGSLFVMRHC